MVSSVSQIPLYKWLTIPVRLVYTQDMTKSERLNNLTASHKNQGHEVWVRCGVVICDDCDEVLDASNHRPGLVAANQSR